MAAATVATGLRVWAWKPVGDLSAGWGDEGRTGWRLGTRLLASVVAKPPAWWRPSYDNDKPLALIGADGDVIGTTRLLSFSAAIRVLAVLAVLAAWCVRSSGRTGFKGAKPMLLVGRGRIRRCSHHGGTVPPDAFGVSVYRYRYLWPLGAFVSATFAAPVLQTVKSLTLPGHWGRGAGGLATGRVATPVIVAFAAVFACLTVPTHSWSEGDFTRRDVWPVTAALRSQLAAVEHVGTVLVETEHVPFPDYFSWAIMAELDRQGVEFVVDTTDAALQVGQRRYDNGTAEARLYVALGDWATATFDGTRLIAFADGGHDELQVGVFIEEPINSPSPTVRGGWTGPPQPDRPRTIVLFS